MRLNKAYREIQRLSHINYEHINEYFCGNTKLLIWSDIKDLFPPETNSRSLGPPDGYALQLNKAYREIQIAHMIWYKRFIFPYKLIFIWCFKLLLFKDIWYLPIETSSRRSGPPDGYALQLNKAYREIQRLSSKCHVLEAAHRARAPVTIKHRAVYQVSGGRYSEIIDKYWYIFRQIYGKYWPSSTGLCIRWAGANIILLCKYIVLLLLTIFVNIVYAHSFTVFIRQLLE